MSTGYFISVFLHILFAAFWIGGMLFLPLVILPEIKRHPDRFGILFRTGLKFRFYGWIALGGLFVTGCLNMYLRGIPISWSFFQQSAYGKLVDWKLLIFLTILILNEIHNFVFGKKALEVSPSDTPQRLLLLARWSGRINLLLALVMAFLGVILSRGGVW